MTQRPQHNLIYNIMGLLRAVILKYLHRALVHIQSCPQAMGPCRANRRLAAGRVNRNCEYQQRNRVHPIRKQTTCIAGIVERLSHAHLAGNAN